MKIQVQSFQETLPELKQLLPGHYAELALNQDKVPLSPRWEIYEQSEQNGCLLFVSVRQEDDTLVGYFIGFINPGLHYSTCKTCLMDIFYIAPDHRGQGLLGLKLFRAVERELQAQGVQRWFAGSKVKADASALFERLNMKKVETVYSKWIGE